MDDESPEPELLPFTEELALREGLYDDDDDDLDDELLYSAELAKYQANLARRREEELDPERHPFSTFFIKIILRENSLGELPHASDVGNAAFSGSERLAWATRAAAIAEDSLQEALRGCDAAKREAILSAVAEAAFTGLYLAEHLVQPIVEQHTRLVQSRFRNTDAASAARRRVDWRQGAQRIWAEHPTWKTHAVANELKRAGVAAQSVDVASISRAIKGLAPETSPSFKPTGPA